MFPTEPTKTVENYHYGAGPAGFSTFNGETGRFRAAMASAIWFVAGLWQAQAIPDLGSIRRHGGVQQGLFLIRLHRGQPQNESACGAKGAGRAGSSPGRPGPAGSFPIPNQRFAQLLFEDDPPCASDSIELGQQAGGM